MSLNSAVGLVGVLLLGLFVGAGVARAAEAGSLEDPADVASAEGVLERSDAPVAAPLRVDAVAPQRALARSTVRLHIEGSGFARGVREARVGLIPLDDLVVESDTRLHGTTQALPSGPYDLTVELFSGHQATLREAVRFDADTSLPAPLIASVAPGRVAAGEPLLVAGAAFAEGLRVELGGRLVDAVVRIDGAHLQVTPPPDFPSGHYGLVVVNPDGQFDTATAPVEVTTPVEPRTDACACRTLHRGGAGASPWLVLALAALGLAVLRLVRPLRCVRAPGVGAVAIAPPRRAPTGRRPRAW